MSRWAGPDEYGQDRAFVAIATERDAPDKVAMSALHAAGHPVLSLTTRLDGLGAEFFRWEFATAVAGAALHINPFDEPNVAEAKAKTGELLKAFAAQHRLEEAAPLVESDEVAVYTRGFAGASPAALIRAALTEVKPGDYVAFLSYLPPDSDIANAIAAIRQGIRRQTRAATTFGIGPRYLHSTGQYHKGGPNTALIFLITSDDETGDGDSGGGVFVCGAEAGTSARGLRDARSARPPRRAAARQARGGCRGAGALVCGGAPVDHHFPSFQAAKIPRHSQLPSAKPELQLEIQNRLLGIGSALELGIWSLDLTYFLRASRALLPDSASTSLCRLLPCASMVTIAGKSRTCRCHIASGVPNSVSDTPSTRSIQRA